MPSCDVHMYTVACTYPYTHQVISKKRMMLWKVKLEVAQSGTEQSGTHFVRTQE